MKVPAELHVSLYGGETQIDAAGLPGAPACGDEEKVVRTYELSEAEPQPAICGAKPRESAVN